MAIVQLCPQANHIQMLGAGQLAESRAKMLKEDGKCTKKIKGIALLLAKLRFRFEGQQVRYCTILKEFHIKTFLNLIQVSVSKSRTGLFNIRSHLSQTTH